MGNYLNHLRQLSSPGTFLSKKKYFDYNIAEYLPKKPQKDIEILEIGPGLGEFVSFLNDKKINKIDILDNDGEVLKYVSSRFKIRNSIPVKDISSAGKKLGKYDLIMMMQVLEHLPLNIQGQVVDMLFKHLKNGGYLFIIVPNANNPLGITERYSDIQHTASFTTQSLLDLVGMSAILGFEVSVKGFEIPADNPLNILRKILQKLLHLLILAVMIINGGLFFKTLTPNIMLVIKRK